MAKIKLFPSVLLLIICALFSGCQSPPAIVEELPAIDPALIPEGMSAEEASTLATLELVDDYPLYTMTYYGEYVSPEATTAFRPAQLPSDWACSLFAIFGDPDEILFGRNFDWDFSPGLLLYTFPEDGYASVSMVDLYYLGFGDERAHGLQDLSFEELEDLLYAPYLPFDGLNEAGLAIGMAAVPAGGVPPDPEKETVDSLLIMRKILDGAATIEEAVEIFQTYNIEWGSGPDLHYLVAEASGRSILVEFSGGDVHFIENQEPWQSATNYLISEAWAEPETHCWRHGVITERLEENAGRINSEEAMALLEDVSQGNTQWSVLYNLNTGDVQIAMGRDYQEVLKLDFEIE
jgi:hypothetical protein